MGGFGHGSEHPVVHEDAAISARNARYGGALFLVYLILYGGFVLLNAFAPERMEQTPFLGINLAVIYGMVLILAALVLALAYGWLCRSR